MYCGAFWAHDCIVLLIVYLVYLYTLKFIIILKVLYSCWCFLMGKLASDPRKEKVRLDSSDILYHSPQI
jgi:hypothetical protein